MEPVQEEPRAQGHPVQMEMVERGGAAFRPAGAPPPVAERETLLNRIAPRQPEGALDGRQGRHLTVGSGNNRGASWTSPSTWCWYLRSRFFSNRCLKCGAIVLAVATVAGGVWFVAWYASSSATRPVPVLEGTRPYGPYHI